MGGHVKKSFNDFHFNFTYHSTATSKIKNEFFCGLDRNCVSNLIRPLIRPAVNGTLGWKILNAERFVTTKQAQIVINHFLKPYNHIRPHQAFNMPPPIPETLFKNNLDVGARQPIGPNKIKFENGGEFVR